MPNEEPEFPPPPPPTETKSATIETKNNETQKTIVQKWHIVLGSILSIYLIAVYIICTVYYYSTFDKLNEFYSLSTNISFAGIFFIIFDTWNRANVNIHIRAITMACSLFFAIHSLIYSAIWIVRGEAYSYYKIALLASLIITLIIWLYNVIKNPHRKY